jgi:hypothetical protein
VAYRCTNFLKYVQETCIFFLCIVFCICVAFVLPNRHKACDVFFLIHDGVSDENVKHLKIT